MGLSTRAYNEHPATMQFTARELRLIERLRKQERKWPRGRWYLLVTAILTYAIYGYIGYYLIETLGSDKISKDDATMMVALFWPKCILMFAVASWLLVLAIRDWHGNVNRMLLLKLLDEHTQETGN